MFQDNNDRPISHDMPETDDQILDRYLDYWDGVVSDWTRGSSSWFHGCFHDPILRNLSKESNRQKRYCKNRTDSNGKPKTWFCIRPDLMPEPYWGNPKKCTIVIADYNPTASAEPVFRPFHDAAVQMMTAFSREHGYRALASSFPLLLSNRELLAKEIGDNGKETTWTALIHYAGRDWWRETGGRMLWARRICEGLKSENPELAAAMAHCEYPFAMEMCGWHSPTWPHSATMALQPWSDKFRSLILDPLFAAVRSSKSHVGLCVGREWFDVLCGFENRFERQKEKQSFLLLPEHPDKRFHAVFSFGDNCKILVTWNTGARFKTPDEAFCKHELDLLAGKSNNEWRSKMQFSTVCKTTRY